MNTHRWLISLSGAAVILAIDPVSAAEISRTPFQYYIAKPCGGSIGDCAFDFPKAKANTRLEARNVSCFLWSAPNAIFRVQLIVQNSHFEAVSRSTLAMQLVNTGTIGGVTSSVWAANHSIFAVASARQHFQIYGQPAALAWYELDCHISGDLVELEPAP